MACLHPVSWKNRWILTKLVHIYFCNMEKNWLDFGDLDPIFKVTGEFRLLVNGLSCMHPITWRNGWILTKLVHLYSNDMEKNWLDFGDLDPIFEVTHGLRLFENGLSASYLMKEWMDLNKTCTAVFLWHEKELIRFWWPWPHFQGHRRA